jgi:7-cyano-7-deazaguanine synthase
MEKERPTAYGKRAIVLSSGGLDSTTVMAMAKQEGYEIWSLSFLYGQRHAVEIEAARKVANALGAREHLVVTLDLAAIGGSSLTGDMEVPKDRPPEEMVEEIPTTYVPARNTIFLAYALAWAEVLGIPNIFVGMNALDYSGYPDCRREYVEAFEHLANLATKAASTGRMRTRIRAPLMEMSKGEIIRKGMELGVDYGMTHSCYDPQQDGLACGRCDSCLLRKQGFAQAGVDDPTLYVDQQRISETKT